MFVEFSGILEWGGGAIAHFEFFMLENFWKNFGSNIFVQK